ncbi:MAG TPA: hypothetical protein VGK45_17870 [Thermoanaerobaculia bacterium]|jgi:hypothetical protein
MAYLPSEEAQERLLRDLGELIAARGSAAFLTAPIVEPDRRFLPDAWNGDLASTQVLLRRLMLYAGLDLAADLHVGEPPVIDGKHVLAWFEGIEQGRCKFGLDIEQLGDAQILIAALCHEIGHAFRAYHGLEKDDRNREEDLTDLTTIYLGFGIFTVNSSDRFEQTYSRRGRVELTRMRLTQAGYLSPQEMSFLLAVQLVARGLPPSRCKAVARRLETNQAEYVPRAVRHLAARRPELLATLGLPPDAAGVDKPDLELLARPLAGSEGKIAVTSEAMLPADQKAGPVDDYRVFAVRESRGPVIMAAILIAFAGLWSVSVIGFRGGEPILLSFLLAAAGVAVPSYLLTRQRIYRCSDNACTARIPPGAETCPGCDCPIGGWIKSKSEIYRDED